LEFVDKFRPWFGGMFSRPFPVWLQSELLKGFYISCKAETGGKGFLEKQDRGKNKKRRGEGKKVKKEKYRFKD
jgi:hypothetical protein